MKKTIISIFLTAAFALSACADVKIPWSSITGVPLNIGADGATIFGATDPGGGTGKDGDVYVNTTTGGVWLRTSGSWTQQSTIPPQTVIDAKSDKVPTPNTQTANYTLAVSDVGKALFMNLGSPNTVTIPNNSTVAIPVGAKIPVQQIGAGSTSFVFAGGVTPVSYSGTQVIGAVGHSGFLHKSATNTWELTIDSHDNFTTSDPGTTNDTTQGYQVGSIWRNTSTNALWQCVDNTTSAAVWTLISTPFSFPPVKTANYTALPNEFVRVDTTAGAVIVTLPTAPTNGTRNGVKLVAGTNPVTISRGGSTDVFNIAGGSSTLALNLINESKSVQYDPGSAIWSVTAGDTPNGQIGDNVTLTQTAGHQWQWAGTFNPAAVGLTDATTITSTCSTLKAIQNWSVTLGGNRTLGTPTGLTAGMQGILVVKQDATGTRTLALWSGAKVINGGGGTVTLSSAANAVDVLTWYYDGTNTWWTFGKNFN